MAGSGLLTTTPTRITEFVNEFENRKTEPGDLEAEIAAMSPLFKKAFQEGQSHTSTHKAEIGKVNHSSLPPKFQALATDIDTALSVYTGGEVYGPFNKETRDTVISYGHERFRFPVLFQLLCAGTKFLRNGNKEGIASVFYRGMGISVKTLNPGDSFSFPQMISTSTNKEKALEYVGERGTLFEFVKDDTELWCVNLDAHSLKGKAEAEYLFHPAHEITVVSVEELGNGIQSIRCKVQRCRRDDDDDEDKKLKPPTNDQMNDLGNGDETNDDGRGDRRRPIDKTDSEPESKKGRPSNEVDSSSEAPA